jgi:hypothetical protein
MLLPGVWVKWNNLEEGVKMGNGNKLFPETMEVPMVMGMYEHNNKPH